MALAKTLFPNNSEVPDGHGFGMQGTLFNPGHPCKRNCRERGLSFFPEGNEKRSGRLSWRQRQGYGAEGWGAARKKQPLGQTWKQRREKTGMNQEKFKRPNPKGPRVVAQSPACPEVNPSSRHHSIHLSLKGNPSWALQKLLESVLPGSLLPHP